MILHMYSITNDTTNDLGLISVPQALSACQNKRNQRGALTRERGQSKCIQSRKDYLTKVVQTI
jgi:hypothetical protein